MKKEISDDAAELIELKKRYIELEDKFKQLLEKVRTKNLEH